METSAQQCARLLAALEELVTQESLLIGAENYTEVTRVQERAAPLIDRLANLAPSAEPAARERVERLIRLRAENQERIAFQVSRVETELNETREARSRLTHVAPAYRVSPPTAVRRLRAKG